MITGTPEKPGTGYLAWNVVVKFFQNINDLYNFDKITEDGTSTLKLTLNYNII